MSKAERATFCAVLFGVGVLIALDLKTDFSAGQSLDHVALDLFLGLGGLIGLLLIWRHMGRTRHHHVTQIVSAESNASTAQSEAQRWKMQAEAVQKGIADEIERQLTAWSLTPSEKEVAFFLLKGLSIKEISTIRQTAERTVRHHTLSIYAKAGVTGRAELSAFFLEDLLDRQSPLTVLNPHRIKARQQD